MRIALRSRLRLVRAVLVSTRAVWEVTFGHTNGSPATIVERVAATGIGLAIAQAKVFHADDEGLEVIRAERVTVLSK